MPKQKFIDPNQLSLVGIFDAKPQVNGHHEPTEAELREIAETKAVRVGGIEKVVGRYKKISREYEADLVERAQNGCLRSRDFLIVNNLGFALQTIQKHHPTYDASELLSSACLGLDEAIRRFNPHKGFRFISYAVWWIRSRLQEQAVNDRLVRHPQAIIDTWGKIKRMVYGENISLQNAIDAMELSPKVAEAIKNISLPISSMNAQIGQGEDGLEFGDLIEDADAEQPLWELEKKQIKDEVRACLTTLESKERYVIMEYYGFSNGGEGRTLEDIGGELKLSRERIRQIVAKALPTLLKRFARRGINESVLEMFI